jgi:hypothetical protein
MLNQRGTLHGAPFLDCPGDTEFFREVAKQELSYEARKSRETGFWPACYADLRRQGVNLDAYNSGDSVADRADLRLALGYEQVNLYEYALNVDGASRTCSRIAPPTCITAVLMRT